tara:strand:- start:2216 stop:3034 length:819 start_codon:yes stop_codon:yes gene_type:complete
MKTIQPIRRFNKIGLDQFKVIIERRRRGENVDVDNTLLLSQQTTTQVDPTIDIDYSRTFGDRLECAEYIWKLLEEKWENEWEHDVGLWTWFAALYFEQFSPTPKKTNRQEHYILSIGEWGAGSIKPLAYRHCVWGPVLTLRNPKLKHLSEFIILGTKGKGRGMHEMGDAVEQTLSTGKIIRSTTALKTIEELYVDKKNRTAKKGFASAPKLKKLKGGGYSKVGAGGIRRLHLVFSRLKLTYNVELLDSDEVLDLCGPEFSASKWNVGHVAES